jgi:hypothetical protein
VGWARASPSVRGSAQVLRAMTVAKKTVMADALKTIRENMQKEAP